LSLTRRFGADLTIGYHHDGHYDQARGRQFHDWLDLGAKRRTFDAVSARD
jgi:hypothetical protein